MTGRSPMARTIPLVTLLVAATFILPQRAIAQSTAAPGEAAAIQELALASRKVRYVSDAEGDNVTNQQPGNIARAWELWKERAERKWLRPPCHIPPRSASG
jgi:hypothetical protein